MKLVERIKEGIDELFPFNPDMPVSTIILAIVDILDSELGRDLLAVKHLGSTVQTPENLARPDYKPPHRNSDIDILAVLSDSADVALAYENIYTYLSNHPFTSVALDIHFANINEYLNASIHGHPTLLFYAHAQLYGNDVGPRSVD